MRGIAGIRCGFHECIRVGFCIVEGHHNLFLFTVIGHAGQVMPETFNVTVCGDAQAGALNTSAVTTLAIKVFIFFISIPL